MKIIKILIIPPFFYFLVLFQTSFLVHFNISNWIPNLALIAVLLLIFWGDAKDSIWGAICAGFFLDIFSNNFIGFHIFILLGIVILLQIIFKRYVQIPVLNN